MGREVDILNSIKDYADSEEAPLIYQEALEYRVKLMEQMYINEKSIHILEHYFETGELLDPGNDFEDDPDFSLGLDPTDE